MDGILLIDKPAGPTSHDVVARVRRVSNQRSVGHTGTLDPRATGLLPLVLGKATRLAALLTGGDKTYDATIRLGVSTTTDDAAGEPLGEPATAMPTEADVAQALEAFRGAIVQLPPAHSAKKIGGRKAYDLARRDLPVPLQPVEVTVRHLDLMSVGDGLVRLVLTVSSGFYVRALARDLGQALGCGGHLESLRRTRSGSFDISQAIPLDAAERAGTSLAERLITPSDALPQLQGVTLNEAGLRRALHGNQLESLHLEGRWVPPASAPGPIKVLAPDGQLVALAWSRGGALHPVVVLG